MKRISYAGGVIVTGDEIADTIMDYAAMLARAGIADHVRVPAIASDDSVFSVDLLIGPASQLIAEPVDSPHDDLVDRDLVEDLRHKARLVRGGHDEFIGGEH